MRREKQYDMFDVAIGVCTLEDYLFQRYSENDLSSVFWIDEKDEVDELRPPKPNPDGSPGTEPIIIPIQGPRAPKKPGRPKLPEIPEGLKPEKEPADPKVPLQPAAQSTAPDGLDKLESSKPTEAPSLESFKAGGIAPPPKVDGKDGFSSSGEGQESKEKVTLSEPPTQTPQSGPSAPSMEELLAKFHQATQQYEERASSSLIEPSDSSDSDEESADPT